ncbi:cytochrome c oxidase subunit VIII [Saccharomycopsis crataegensis]|uniref:Cytochrome c oxidase subunit 8, mitochondrial n=1 Tax=Saccharomycopsis crataegensis TaxID=43959 RepID=A0AAV5QI51_9ASCO|nr:cytochrome c oxidase subunit VIII [Saccharomycopsis crataegensis]
MFARQTTAAARNVVSKRAFSTTTTRASGHYAEGPYSNLPFKVHNRKIPYAAIHFGFFGLGFALPFVAVGWQLYKSGSFNN